MTTTTKPKQYIRPMKPTWWLHNRPLMLWTLRELSSVFVGAYALFLLYVLVRSGDEPDRFHAFFHNVILSPWVIGLQILALIFVIYHGITTCNAAPVLMVVWRGEEKVDPRLIIAGNYGIWLLLSVLVVAAALWMGR